MVGTGKVGKLLLSRSALPVIRPRHHFLLSFSDSKDIFGLQFCCRYLQTDWKQTSPI